MALASPTRENSAHQRNDKPGGDTVENIRSFFDHAERLRQDFRRRFPQGVVQSHEVCSLDRLDPVAVDVHQFMSGAKCGNVGPNPLKKGVQVPYFHIADPEMNHPRWRLVENGQDREICVLGDDSKLLLPRIPPDFTVRPGIVQVEHMQIVLSLPQAESIGQIRIDYKSCHRSGH